MKKIIYSLVIMIAAGSLFTSCIEQVEPLGIQDMRFAKAEYIRALKDLRAADAEYVRAQAAFELARARYKDAQTANLNADTEYQKLLNEYQQLLNEARQDTNDVISAQTANKIDKIKKQMELRELQHKKDLVDAEKDLAYAREQLRVALRDIALYSQSLTPAEQSALAAAVYMYETAFEETADQTIVVLQAQRTLDSLKLVREVGPDTAYDKSSKAYIGQVDKWKKDIETKQVEQALVAALLLAVPDSLVYDDVDGWKEQIDELVKDSTELAYNQYQVKTEMANYYTANIHDGVKVFNAMITEFKNEWWEGGTVEPTAPSKPGTEPKPTDKKYNPENYLSDSLKFKPFVLKDQEITPRSFNKFAYLLGSYMQDSPYSESEPKNPIMGLNTANDTLFIVGPVQQDMKDFILGAEGNGEKSQKGTFNKEDLVANYGLWGAYDILAREMVTKKDAAADPEKALEALELADSIWAAHRQILIDGLAAYEPYAEAIAQYEADVEENGKGATAMVAAVAALRDELAGVDGVADFASFTINDSTAIFNALVNFAIARESYLEYDPEGQPHDLDYFRYAKSRTAGEVVVDSVLFSALSWDDFKAHRYDYDPETGETIISHKDVSDTPALNKEDGFMNIATQLLGSAVATKAFNYPCKTEPSETVDPDKLSKEDFNGTVAFYKLYDIDGYVDPKPTKILLTGTSTEYVPGNIDDDKDAIEDAVKDFVAVYNSFWNLSVTATMAGYTVVDGYYDLVESGADAEDIAEAKANAEATIENKPTDTPAGLFVYNADDVKRYTLNTFKPYVEYAPIVAFTNGVSIDTTDAMKAILTAVDPKSNSLTDNTQWDGDIFENQSAIFKGKATDFWKFMKAYSDYYDAVNDKVEEDLAYIKAWIEGVEATFEADEEAAPGKATKQYNDDHKAWETTKKNYDTKKAAYDEYVAAKAEFAGITVDEKGDTTVNAIVGPLTDPSATTIPGQEFATIASVEIPELVEGKNVYGFYPGEWSEKLGGAQLEAAQMLFPEYPVELQEWDVTIQETDDQLTHYATLIQAAKKAYFLSAQIAGEDVASATGAKPTNFDQLVENYKAANKRYRERLIGIIEDLQAEIETMEQAIAKFNQGIPQLDIAIAIAEKELTVEKARLQGYEEALAYAKANLDHLLEYIKSLDVNFVVPAVDFDD